MYKLMVVILTLFIAGCTTTQSSNQLIPIEQKTFSQSYDNVVQASVDALRQQNWRVIDIDKKNGAIKAITPANLLTMGDEVLVFVSKRGNSVQVDVDSSSRQAYDWGKGKDNLLKFYQSLKQYLSVN